MSQESYVKIKNVGSTLRKNRRTNKAKTYRSYRQMDDRYRVVGKTLADIVL